MNGLRTIIRFMKYLLGLIACIPCQWALSQIVSPPLACGKHFLGPPLEVQFKGEIAVANFKDESHTLKFNRTWVTTQGEHWSDYTDGNYILASSYPDEPYVAISLKNQKNAFASCDVIELTQPATNH